MEKASTTGPSFSLSLLVQWFFRNSRSLRTEGKSAAKKISSVRENLTREYLKKVKSIEQKGMHTTVLRGMDSVITGPLAIIFERLWQILEVSKDWKTANAISVFRKGRN